MTQEELRERLVREAHALDHEGELTTSTHSARARNPLCGDDLELQVEVADGQIVAAKSRVRGCLVTSAAAHTLARSIEGLSVSQAQALAQDFLKLLGEGSTIDLSSLRELSDYSIFQRPHPRQKCARLGAEALLKALESFVEN